MQIVSIQVGSAAVMLIDGGQVMSAIGKSPVTGRVKVGALGIEGDEQVDLSVHGGLAKAVYAYPSEHYAYWRTQMAPADPTPTLGYGGVGENLTLSGLLEADAFVGDELHFRDCILQITQPRMPCFKFNAVMKDKRAAKKMAQTGFCGFYLSVVKAGSIEAGESFRVIAGSRQTSISSMFRVSMGRARGD